MFGRDTSMLGKLETNKFGNKSYNGRGDAYLLLPGPTCLLKALLGKLDFFFEVFLHVGFKHAIAYGT